MTLHLTDADVAKLVSPAEAVELIEACCYRIADATAVSGVRQQIPAPAGHLALMGAIDTELGYAATKSYLNAGGTLAFVISLFSLEDGALMAVLEGDRIGWLRTGAATAVAARQLASASARSVGLIGAGHHAVSQLAHLRAALPQLERAIAWAPNPDRLAAFCAATGAHAAPSVREASEQAIVVTATTARDPVLRGDWLREGALVCAIGANGSELRELDTNVLARASFVCCDSLEQSRLEAGDLIGPVEAGTLDWLEVHELHAVVAGATSGRTDPSDIIVFKSNGLAAWDLAVAAAAYERARATDIGKLL